MKTMIFETLKVSELTQTDLLVVGLIMVVFISAIIGAAVDSKSVKS